ncbi:MAG: hypothetical protein ACI90V_012898, partial [Bacillariaceae sp.]
YDIIHTSTSMVAIVTILSFAEIMRDSISMALIDVQTQQQQHRIEPSSQESRIFQVEKEDNIEHRQTQDY